jgi:hypothetical protein
MQNMSLQHGQEEQHHQDGEKNYIIFWFLSHSLS